MEIAGNRSKKHIIMVHVRIYLHFKIALSSLKNLTWHNEALPSDEIWLKIGGDKGGSSFKMNFQIVNVQCPNSVGNTCVFVAFQAPDSLTNLHVALDRYKEQLDVLQHTQWK